MIDESNSNTIEKLYIVYVRYIENDEPKTSYYGLLDVHDARTSKSIVQSLKKLWSNDDLCPNQSCWLASDDASIANGKSK